MKIGLYFGSFNPIHIGHLIIANHISENSDLQQIWFVVSPHNPLKKRTSLLNEYQRLFLVQLAIEDNLKFRATDIEFKMNKPSYTIDTLIHLKEKYPQHEFAIIIGADSLHNIKKWKNYELLLSEYFIYVYPRLSHEIETPQSGNITIVNAPLLDISSTFIRRSLFEKKSIKYLIPEKVLKEIEQNNYYKK